MASMKFFVVLVVAFVCVQKAVEAGVTANPDQCVHEGHTYNRNEEFTIDCMTCTCLGAGKIPCLPKCGVVDIFCPPGLKANYAKVDRGNGCFCKEIGNPPCKYVAIARR